MSETEIELTLKFDHSVNVFVLQPQGWAPVAACGVSNVFLDRNAVSALKDRDRSPNGAREIAQRWWLDQLNCRAFNLSPVIAAAEGSQRRFPSLNEFRDQIAEASDAIASGLPDARIAVYGASDLQAIHSMFQTRWVQSQAEREFLMSVSPLVANRVARSKLRRVEGKVLSLATSVGLRRTSLPVVAALSCLYEYEGANAFQIGRKIIKPSLSYSDGDAHNAVADLQSLEFLAILGAILDENAGMCTCDRALAAFWHYLNLRASTFVGQKSSFRCAPDPRLFPRLPEGELPLLVHRMCGDA